MRESSKRFNKFIFKSILLIKCFICLPSISSEISKTDKTFKKEYNPALLRIDFTSDPKKEEGYIDLTLITTSGNPIGKRQKVQKNEFFNQLRSFYTQVASIDSLNESDPSSPTRQVYNYLIGSISNELIKQKISTLLISTDSAFHSIPFAALHNGKDWFGSQYAFSITPSINLMQRAKSNYKKDSSTNKILLAGATNFSELSPLPLVNQELKGISQILPSKTYLNDFFTSDIIKKDAISTDFNMVHIATHSEFIPKNPTESKLYFSKGFITLREIDSLRLYRAEKPLELFVLSSCRSALGDDENELGIAGLALQTGSHTAIGTLWYVDDIVTSAFFIRFYRILEKGFPKAEALRRTRIEFLNKLISFKDNNLIDYDGNILLRNLSNYQISIIKKEINHPFYWSAPVMLGKPW